MGNKNSGTSKKNCKKESPNLKEQKTHTKEIAVSGLGSRLPERKQINSELNTCKYVKCILTCVPVVGPLIQIIWDGIIVIINGQILEGISNILIGSGYLVFDIVTLITSTSIITTSLKFLKRFIFKIFTKVATMVAKYIPQSAISA